MQGTTFQALAQRARALVGSRETRPPGGEGGNARCAYRADAWRGLHRCGSGWHNAAHRVDIEYRALPQQFATVIEVSKFVCADCKADPVKNAGSVEDPYLDPTKLTWQWRGWTRALNVERQTSLQRWDSAGRTSNIRAKFTAQVRNGKPMARLNRLVAELTVADDPGESTAAVQAHKALRKPCCDRAADSCRAQPSPRDISQ